MVQNDQDLEKVLVDLDPDDLWIQEVFDCPGRGQLIKRTPVNIYGDALLGKEIEWWAATNMQLANGQQVPLYFKLEGAGTLQEALKSFKPALLKQVKQFQSAVLQRQLQQAVPLNSKLDLSKMRS